MMRLEQFIKEIKKLKDVKINYEINDNIFKGYIQGIINNMEKKRSKFDLLFDEMKNGFSQMNSRLDNVERRLDKLETDVSQLKSDVSQLKNEAINHGWNINVNK